MRQYITLNHQFVNIGTKKNEARPTFFSDRLQINYN